MDRRSFFRQLMLRGLDRAEQTTQKIGQRYQSVEQFLTGEPAAAKKGQAMDQSGPPRVHPPVSRFLRPPGALAEAKYVDTCASCGLCVQACPASAILLDPQQAGGHPYILPRSSPCVMCLKVPCTHVCPSGALQPIDDPLNIRIGLAKIDPSRCLRSPAPTVSRGGSLQAEDCTICVSQCPVGATALAINDEGELEVHDACTGCGVCERACPTEPASIYIIPTG